MPQESVSAVLVVDTDTEGVQQRKDCPGNLICLLILDHAGGRQNNAVRVLLIPSKNRPALSVKSEGGVYFTAVMQRILHSQDRVQFLNKTAEKLFQLPVFLPKLLFIADSLKVAAAACLRRGTHRLFRSACCFVRWAYCLVRDTCCFVKWARCFVRWAYCLRCGARGRLLRSRPV